jgi:hypothetical protein
MRGGGATQPREVRFGEKGEVRARRRRKQEEKRL